ncbi:MAG: DUF4389 domain-containing protein [Bacteroidetes bacterium]|nr:DUF4389 domain-containing protein [Bacteroidota bacterium]
MFSLIRPEAHSRLLLVLRPVMIIPVFLWAFLYSIGAAVIHFLSFWSIMFSGKHPAVLWDFLEGYFRFAAKMQAYMLYLSDQYPPFTGGSELPHEVMIHVEYAARMSRTTTFFRPLLLFPHFFFCIGYSAVYGIVHVLIFWTVLFSGRMPEWQREQAEAYFVYMSRISAYALLLVDEYPPFNGSQPRAAELLFG